MNLATEFEKPAVEKWQKGGQKSNITAKRLTIVPSFLNYQTNQSQECANEHNFHGLFYDNKQKLRRSWRLKKNQTKSIFKDINNKFQLITKTNNNNSSNCSKFCTNLWNKPLSLVEPILNCRPIGLYKERIHNEINTINQLLIGGRMSANNYPQPQQQFTEMVVDENNKENLPQITSKLQLLPKSKWIYQTPPNRKFNFNFENSTMQPAVISTINQKTIMYEVNRNINVDLSKFHHNQTLDVDKRYMTEIASFNNNNSSTSNHQQQPHKFLQPASTSCQHSFVKPKSFDELEQHFLSLTSRPKRKIVASARKTIMKPKRHIFGGHSPSPLLLPPRPIPSTITTTATNHQTLTDATFVQNNTDEQMMDVQVTEEQSFRFKFSQPNRNQTNCQLFDFHGEMKESFHFQPDNN